MLRNIIFSNMGQYLCSNTMMCAASQWLQQVRFSGYFSSAAAVAELMFCDIRKSCELPRAIRLHTGRDVSSAVP
jgi:hypothetical protein